VQQTVGQNPGSQPTVAPKKFLSPWRNRAIHPVTRPALLSSVKTNALNFKIFSNQSVQIDAAHEDIPSNRTRIDSFELERAAKLIENVQGEKRDLSLVIFFVIEIPIPAKTTSGDTFYRLNLNRRKIIRLAPMVSDKIVAF